MNYMKDSEIMECLANVKDSIFFHRKKFNKTMLKYMRNHYRYMFIYLRYQNADMPVADVVTAEEADLMEKIKAIRTEIGKVRHTESFTEFAVLNFQAIERELIKVNEEEIK